MFFFAQGFGQNEQLSSKDREVDETLSSQQTQPGQPGGNGGNPMVHRPIERNTGPLESQRHSASTPPTPLVTGASSSMGDSGLPYQVGASAPLGGEELSSPDKPGDTQLPALKQERRPSFDNKVGLNEGSSSGDKTQTAMKGETSSGESVRGPADLENGELDTSQTGSDDGASIAEKEVTQSKKSFERAPDTSSNQQQKGKGRGTKKKADPVKSGKDHRPQPSGQSVSSRNVNKNSQNPTSLSPYESTTQKVAKDKSALVGNAHGCYCSLTSHTVAILRMDTSVV